MAFFLPSGASASSENLIAAGGPSLDDTDEEDEAGAMTLLGAAVDNEDEGRVDEALEELVTTGADFTEEDFSSEG